MRRILTAAFLVMTVALFSCKSGGDKPEAVLSNFFDALSKKDIEKARTYATADSKSMLDMMDMAMKMDNKENTESEFDKANLEFGEAIIDGDKATVEVKNKKAGESMKYILKKEEGKWKVAFDKSSLMESATDAIGTDGTIDPGAFDYDATADSIKNELNKELEKELEANPQ
jgi:hypothetical protein